MVGFCQIHGVYDECSSSAGCPRCLGGVIYWPPSAPPMWLQPPPVCTGTGHRPAKVADDLGATGVCGICGATVGLEQPAGVVRTHPYLPRREETFHAR